MYQIQTIDPHSHVWRPCKNTSLHAGNRPNAPIPTYAEAVETAKSWVRSQTSAHRKTRIINLDTGEETTTEIAPTMYQFQYLTTHNQWKAPRGYGPLDTPNSNYSVLTAEREKRWSTVNSRFITRIIRTDTQQEVTGPMDITPELAKPLNLKRQDLIRRLEDNLKEEVKKREEAEQELADARKAAIEAIEAFTSDELYNIFHGRWTIQVESLEKAKELKTYVTQELKPTPTETKTEKFVRILKMTDDETIEVVPSDDLYSLL